MRIWVMWLCVVVICHATGSTSNSAGDFVGRWQLGRCELMSVADAPMEEWRCCDGQGIVCSDGCASSVYPLPQCSHLLYVAKEGGSCDNGPFCCKYGYRSRCPSAHSESYTCPCDSPQTRWHCTREWTNSCTWTTGASPSCGTFFPSTRFRTIKTQNLHTLDLQRPLILFSSRRKYRIKSAQIRSNTSLLVEVYIGHQHQANDLYQIGAPGGPIDDSDDSGDADNSNDNDADNNDAGGDGGWWVSHDEHSSSGGKDLSPSSSGGEDLSPSSSDDASSSRSSDREPRRPCLVRCCRTWVEEEDCDWGCMSGVSHRLCRVSCGLCHRVARKLTWRLLKPHHVNTTTALSFFNKTSNRTQTMQVNLPTVQYQAPPPNNTFYHTEDLLFRFAPNQPPATPPPPPLGEERECWYESRAGLDERNLTVFVVDRIQWLRPERIDGRGYPLPDFSAWGMFVGLSEGFGACVLLVLFVVVVMRLFRCGPFERPEHSEENVSTETTETTHLLHRV